MVRCPECDKLLEMSQKMQDKKMVCNHCGNIFGTSQEIENGKFFQPGIKRPGQVPLIIIGTILGIIILTFSAIIFTINLIERKERAKEERVKMEEMERKRNAFRQIVVVNVDFEPAILKGGINLNSITLANPTKYAFRQIKYQFYDINDEIVRIEDYVGPLMPYETRKFNINLHCEGLWEHRYEVKIVEGEVSE